MSEATKGTSGAVACHCLTGCGCAEPLQGLKIANSAWYGNFMSMLRHLVMQHCPVAMFVYHHGLGIELLPLAADVEDCKQLLAKDFNFIPSFRTELQ